MPKVNCYLCHKQMTIDEPNGEAYITDGLIIQYDADSIPISVDERNKKIKHVICPE